MSAEIPVGVPIAATATTLADPAVDLKGDEPQPDGPTSRLNVALRNVLGGSVVLTLAAVLVSLIVGGILIASTNADVQASAGYFLARPGDTFAAIWNSVSGAYVAIFRGGVYDFTSDTFSSGIGSPSCTRAELWES